MIPDAPGGKKTLNIIVDPRLSNAENIFATAPLLNSFSLMFHPSRRLSMPINKKHTGIQYIKGLNLLAPNTVINSF